MSPTAPPKPDDLAHIDTWIFDLDNTLYPAQSRLFDQIDVRIGTFIANHFNVEMDEAKKIQKGFFHEFGTTLRGLMEKHDLEPGPYLEFVHDIDMSGLPQREALSEVIGRLPGRKLVFTNADTPYAERVMAQLGIGDHFEDIYDIKAADYVPKPYPAAYDLLIDRHDVAPETSIFFEDIARNLTPAAALGMVTVWVRNDGTWALPGNDEAEPHYVADDLVEWLEAALGQESD
jgi:putative hydrolase of the HAD superfamily